MARMPATISSIINCGVNDMLIHQPVRNAFTLVELLVAMTIIAILATIAIAFFPNAASAARESRAAQITQSTLLIAKQRALRDQAPRGVRLWIKQPDGSVYAPDAWTVGKTYAVLDAVMSNNISYRCIQANTATNANRPSGAFT